MLEFFLEDSLWRLSLNTLHSSVSSHQRKFMIKYESPPSQLQQKLRVESHVSCILNQTSRARGSLSKCKGPWSERESVPCSSLSCGFTNCAWLIFPGFLFPHRQNGEERCCMVAVLIMCEYSRLRFKKGSSSSLFETGLST